MAATIKDIAKLAGVSPATVSRVLANKTAFFSADTAAKVQTAATTLGYQKNTAAAELVTQQSHVIAAIVNSTKTNFANHIIEGIQDAAYRQGLNVIILYAGDADPEQQRRALTTVIERPVRGILLLSVDLSADNLTYLQAAQIPYCFCRFLLKRISCRLSPQMIGKLAIKEHRRYWRKVIGRLASPRWTVCMPTRESYGWRGIRKP